MHSLYPFMVHAIPQITRTCKTIQCSLGSMNRVLRMRDACAGGQEVLICGGRGWSANV